MSSMFESYGSSSTVLNAVPKVSGWGKDTSNVSSMNNMFDSYGVFSSALTSVPDVSKWDTSNLTSMSMLFRSFGLNSSNLNFALNLSDWNVSKVSMFDQVFYNAGYSTNTWEVSIPAKTGDKENIAEKWYVANENYITPTGDEYPQDNRKFTIVRKDLDSLLNKYEPYFDYEDWENESYSCYRDYQWSTLTVALPDSKHSVISFGLNSEYSVSGNVYTFTNESDILKLTITDNCLEKIEVQKDGHGKTYVYTKQ